MNKFIKVLSEEILYTGGGCNYLEYQVEILEDGGKIYYLYNFWLGHYIL